MPVVDTQASRHDTDADAAPFMGQGNIRTVYGAGESSAFCAVGSTLLWKCPLSSLPSLPVSSPGPRYVISLRCISLRRDGERRARKRGVLLEMKRRSRKIQKVYVCV